MNGCICKKNMNNLKKYIFIVIAYAMTYKEILEDWEWLNKNLLGTLFNFDHEDQITEFVRCKIESLVAHSQPSTPVIEGKK